jgi:hypothetical protein
MSVIGMLYSIKLGGNKDCRFFDGLPDQSLKDSITLRGSLAPTVKTSMLSILIEFK